MGQRGGYRSWGLDKEGVFGGTNRKGVSEGRAE